MYTSNLGQTHVNISMSLSSTSRIKAALTEQLAANAEPYFLALKSFVTGKSSRSEFDDIIRQLLDAPTLVQLHNALIISLFDSTIHRHAPAIVPAPTPVHKEPPLKRRRTDDYNQMLRSTRLKRWTLTVGKRERERVRTLDAMEPPRATLPTDEIASERGVMLLHERGGMSQASCHLCHFATKSFQIRRAAVYLYIY